jgi:hypothetical protein
MKCGKIRDLLATDYIDGEASKEIAGEIKAHLAGCRGCMGYYEQLKGITLMGASPGGEMAPPASMWDGIEKRIRQAESPEGFSLSGILEPILDILARPVVPAMVAVLILFVVVEGIRQEKDGGFSMASEYLGRQANYLSGLGKSPVKASGDNFGTAIEQVFF